jgi:hypothetical protein
MDRVAQLAERRPWGTADEVCQRVVAEADCVGAGTVLVSLNRSAMPHERFLHQICRFAREMLRELQAHQVTDVPLATASPP